ncbi:MAG: dihydropteroate synthase [Turicibacter sp.]|nr:dihydropteroate synthase [Turicibacter sp.]
MKIMGILNVTPDSFSDGGAYVDIEKAVAHAVQMVADGADVIDIGGESTRPGSVPISLEEELARVIPVIQRLRDVVDVPISIDTYKAEVARQAVAAGVTIINDVWAGRRDPEMLRVMAESDAQVVLMHNRTPEQENAALTSIVSEVLAELQATVDLALAAGVEKERIIVDPGIGFGKTLEQNIELIKHIDQLKSLGYPVLLAASKKRTIRALAQTEDLGLGVGVGTLAVTCYACTKGIAYVRVHEVKENKLAINVMGNLE